MNSFQHYPSGHSDFVNDVSFDTSGERIATCSSDNSIRIWRRQTDRSWTPISLIVNAHVGPIHRICWAHSDFGSIIASCSSDRSVAVFVENPQQSATDWIRIATFTDATDDVQGVAFAPHHLGLILATVSLDGSLRLYQCSSPSTDISSWELTKTVPIGITLDQTQPSHHGHETSRKHIRNEQGNKEKQKNEIDTQSDSQHYADKTSHHSGIANSLNNTENTRNLNNERKPTSRAFGTRFSNLVSGQTSSSTNSAPINTGITSNSNTPASGTLSTGHTNHIFNDQNNSSHDVNNPSSTSLSHPHQQTTTSLKQKSEAFAVAWSSAVSFPVHIAVACRGVIHVFAHTRRGAGGWVSVATIPGHKDVVLDIAWAPDAGRSYELLASACRDGNTRIFKFYPSEAQHEFGGNLLFSKPLHLIVQELSLLKHKRKKIERRQKRLMKAQLENQSKNSLDATSLSSSTKTLEPFQLDEAAMDAHLLSHSTGIPISSTTTNQSAFGTSYIADQTTSSLKAEEDDDIFAAFEKDTKFFEDQIVEKLQSLHIQNQARERQVNTAQIFHQSTQVQLIATLPMVSSLSSVNHNPSNSAQYAFGHLRQGCPSGDMLSSVVDFHRYLKAQGTTSDELLSASMGSLEDSLHAHFQNNPFDKGQNSTSTIHSTGQIQSWRVSWDSLGQTLMSTGDDGSIRVHRLLAPNLWATTEMSPGRVTTLSLDQDV